MANWAWPHTPASNFARLILVGGPFDGEEVAFLPPDLSAPSQIAWTGWFPWGFAAYVYEWKGEVTVDHGRTDALVYQFTERRLADMPPLIAEEADLWARTPALIAECFDVPAALLWPGV